MIVALPLLLAAAAPHVADDRAGRRPHARIGVTATIISAEHIIFTGTNSRTDTRDDRFISAAASQDRQRSTSQKQILIEFH